MNNLELAYKPDAAKVCERIEAWWNREIVDRPTIQVHAPRHQPLRPYPAAPRTIEARWMDTDFVVENTEAAIANTYWGGELLPTFQTNLGPEIMTAVMGAPLTFGANTSWTEPILDRWEDIPSLAIDPDNIYLQKLLEITQRALDAGRGKYIVGMTDLHPGADLAASLRDPQQFCLDCAESPDRVLALMDHLRPIFYEFYDMQYAVLREAGQTITTTWLPLLTDGKYYVPSGDFTCMVSQPMFKQFFLSEILEEVEWLDRSIYHLDGPTALRHLDTLLEIPKLGGIQWVYGAGNEPASQWMDVCKKIQAAGKNLHINVDANEVDTFMENLRPEGVMMETWVGSPEEGEALIARVARWRKRA